MRKDLATDWPKASGVAESRLIKVGINDDSAPVEETEPTSSWLNKAIILMLECSSASVMAKDSGDTLSIRACNAQYL